ncbi:hypothetical protein ACSBL2_14620 [Pedobacter sp. AW31-3R]|uniref:hypothetical protein n=1 Tax=Pedobacter sp. AW31-3R TaxID=3445781 RepID=UPI003F9F2787
MSYKNLGEDISSAHFKLERIDLPGRPGYREAKSSVIDSQHTDTLKLLANGEVDMEHPDPPNYLNYSGQVYLDTVSFHFKVVAVEDSVTEGGDVQDGKSRLLTLNSKGTTISKVDFPGQENPELLSSCLLLEDVILPFQPWLDDSQPIYMSHFSRDKFNGHCLNPFRGFGNPNGAGNCYYWEGRGYYRIIIGGEKLKFKVPTSCNALIFTQDSDLEPFVFNFSVVPERFRKRINASFLIYGKQLYMASKK